VALRQMLHLGGKVRTTAEGSMDQHDRRVAASQIFVSAVRGAEIFVAIYPSRGVLLRTFSRFPSVSLNQAALQ
jgi:hypothetical protein